MTCKDCIHYGICRMDVCFIHANNGDTYQCQDSDKVEEDCEAFTDKSELVHLPCKKGDVLIRNGIRCKVDHWNVIATAFTQDEKCRLFGLEEAEKALDDRRKEDDGK